MDGDKNFEERANIQRYHQIVGTGIQFSRFSARYGFRRRQYFHQR
jgi:hypothetical protein